MSNNYGVRWTRNGTSMVQYRARYSASIWGWSVSLCDARRYSLTEAAVDALYLTRTSPDAGTYHVVRYIGERSHYRREIVGLDGAEKFALRSELNGLLYVTGLHRGGGLDCGNLNDAMLFDSLSEALGMLEQGAISRRQTSDDGGRGCWLPVGIREIPGTASVRVEVVA